MKTLIIVWILCIVVTAINVIVVFSSYNKNCIPTQEITSEAQLITAYKQGQESMK